MKKYKFVCSLGIGDVLLQTLVWIVLMIVTFGLALPFFAYFFVRLIINKTEIHEISVPDRKAVSIGSNSLENPSLDIRGG